MADRRTIFRRLAYTAYTGIGTLLATEGVLRVFVSSDPAFYVAFSDPEPGSAVRYPYGEIYYNHDGFADGEFEPVKSKPRVGYLGDSVCFGVGAGYGYRVSEVMEDAYPGYEHMNLSGGLGGGTMQVGEKALAFSERYGLDAVVYMMNLNDIRPDGQGEDLENLRQNPVFNAVEWLRGRVYLYTYARQILKGLRTPKEGAVVYELYPEAHAAVIETTARNVADIGEQLAERGVRFVVLILPYEMQISAEAAEVYAATGREWEDSFITGATQQALMSAMEGTDGMFVFDGLDAFLGPDRDPAMRERFGVGEAFVYNLGERMDWNHPNRTGHRVLAEGLAASGVLDGLGD